MLWKSRVEGVEAVRTQGGKEFPDTGISEGNEFIKNKEQR